MTISVRLTKEIEISLREESKQQSKSISDIVNIALEKYHNEYKYFDSINAHHLDPIVVEAFFSLVDTPEKADKISTAGAAMIEKFATYFSNGDKIIHKHFGEGVLISHKVLSNDIELSIKFKNPYGIKKIMKNRAPISITSSSENLNPEDYYGI